MTTQLQLADLDYIVIEREDMPEGHDFVVIRSGSQTILAIRAHAVRTAQTAADIWAAVRLLSGPAVPRPRAAVAS